MSLLKVGVLALVSAATAFGSLANHHGEFVGRGTWVSADGKKGTWHSEMKIVKAEAGLVVTEKLTVKTPGEADHVEDMKMTVATKDSGFFDITTKDEVSGWGHCDKDLCQMSGADKAKGSTYSETIAFAKGKMYRAGHDSSDKWRIVWKGQMKHKGDKDEQGEQVEQQQQQQQQTEQVTP